MELGQKAEGRRRAPVRHPRVPVGRGGAAGARPLEIHGDRGEIARSGLGTRRQERTAIRKMANIKSAEKRIRQTAKRQLRNRGVRAHLRTKVKQYRQTEAPKKSRGRFPRPTPRSTGPGRKARSTRTPLPGTSRALPRKGRRFEVTGAEAKAVWDGARKQRRICRLIERADPSRSGRKAPGRQNPSRRLETRLAANFSPTLSMTSFSRST